MEFEVANDFKVDDKMLGLEFENEFKVDELDVKVTIVVVENL